MHLKSAPLSAHLIVAFVGLLVCATVALTAVAYHSTIESLEADARRAVAADARAKAQMLTQVLNGRQLSAKSFLASATSVCTEPLPNGGLAWAPDCVEPMLKQFHAAERASGTQFLYRGRRIAAAGAPVSQDLPDDGAIATLVQRDDGRSDYVMRTTRGRLMLVVQFDGRQVEAILNERAGVRARGEVFLAEAQRGFLTPARYWSSSYGLTPPGALEVEPLAGCELGPREVVGADYRGVQVFHGLHPVRALGAACVDAHLAYDEVMAPAGHLRDQLAARGGVFVVLGALLSLLAARRIAAPVKQLATAARALQNGNFNVALPVGGPSEVRNLGLAFQGMATELVTLIEREKAARSDAEAANRSKDDFLATVSHELRTPLSAILGWVHLLRRGSLNAERTRHAIQAIERSAGVQRRLVEDLLDVSRMAAQRVRIALKPTPMAAVVEKALDAVRPQAAEKGVQLETALDEQVVVLADAERLQQIVWNLAWNAVKFTPAGGRVRVTLERTGGMAQLAVADTGIGISRDFLPRVFEWFRQGDQTTGSGSGLGLGLGIVQNLTQLHGGTVRADSAGEGRGSTFIVSLPLYTGAVPSARTGRESSPEPDAALAAGYPAHMIKPAHPTGLVSTIRTLVEP
jgi:signal transduction histidine kinase